MAVHWVNYDLNKAGQDYSGLIEYLKSHQSWARPVKSSYFVKTSLTASQLMEGIRRHIDTNDAVAVVTVSGQSWSTIGIPSEVSTWMQQNI